jgi:tetratricopeptide (TPR) repeat protein
MSIFKLSQFPALVPASLLAFATSMVAQGATAPLTTHGSDACTSSESWSFSGAVFESKRGDFVSGVHGSIAPVRGFSEALAMRRFAANTETRTLGEYWISRSLYDAKLMHIAYGGFVSIASRPVKPDTAGIQISAVECLLQIQSHYPAMSLPSPVVARIAELREQAASPQMRDVVWQAASAALRAQLPVKHSSVTALLEVLKGAGPYENFARALTAARDNDHNTSVTQMDHFFATPSLPPALKRFVGPAHILMARDLYSLQQFERASAHLKQIPKSSNDLALALEELSWAYLMNDRLPEAIGTAMSLQSGGLRHTYAPEAPMVMAMSLNELCQYPESVRAIRIFKKNYEKAFQWLQQNVGDSLYSQAIQYVRRAPGVTVPDRIASEWVRSPLFISSQDELNLLFDESEGTVALGHSGAIEQAKLAENVVQKAKTIPSRLRAAKAKMAAGDHLPDLLMADMLALKEMILHYRRLQQGAPVWHTILASYKKTAPSIKTRLISGINSDLKLRSGRMLAQLEEIAENVQLIEVEIYNGASQDIIWQNAHPDFKKMAAKMKDDRREPASKSWDWGKAQSGLEEEGGEVWEDELGSFAANLVDNCSSKDKYLAIHAGR